MDYESTSIFANPFSHPSKTLRIILFLEHNDNKQKVVFKLNDGQHFSAMLTCSCSSSKKRRKKMARQSQAFINGIKSYNFSLAN